MHACATAKLESQRTAGSKTPGEGAQRPRGALNYYYATVGPKRHQARGTGGHAGGSGGTPKGPEGTRVIQETPRGPEGAAGIKRDTKRTGGNNGGVRAGRKATMRQQGPNIYGARTFALLACRCAVMQCFSGLDWVSFDPQAFYTHYIYDVTTPAVPAFKKYSAFYSYLRVLWKLQRIVLS